MKYTKLHYQVALTLLNGIGPIKARAILNHFPDLEEFFKLNTRKLKSQTELNTAFISKMAREKALEESSELVEEVIKRSINPIFINDPKYPRRLKQIPDAPVMLYKKGAMDVNFPKVVSIVGTRNCTNYGVQLCQNLIESFSEQNILVASGLAVGIDACAHRSCLEYNVPTVAVLGHGLDRVYPSIHRELADQIIERGCVITEFPTGTNPDRENFPKRNRIVAGMADATIVIESKKRGGSLITAYLASDYNRDVFAFPGNVLNESSQGCNELIRSNRACLIQSADEFLEMMSWEKTVKNKHVQRRAFTNLSPMQELLTSLIYERPKIHLDLIAAKSNLPITALNKELFTLEMNGVIQSLPGNTYAIA